MQWKVVKVNAISKCSYTVSSSWRKTLGKALSVPEYPLLPIAHEPVFKQCVLFGKKALGHFTGDSMGIWPTYRKIPRKIISSCVSQQQLPVVPCPGQGCGGRGRAGGIASSQGCPPSRTLQGADAVLAPFMCPPFLCWAGAEGQPSNGLGEVAQTS